jgi:ribosomal protein S27AE
MEIFHIINSWAALPSSSHMTSQTRSHEWYKFRDRIIERDGDMCVRCGRGGADGIILQVHHKEYITGRKLWEYPDDYCETLCRGCHAAEHGIVPPRNGWEFIFDEDLGEMDGICENCGAELRYVFYVHHPSWGIIGVGTNCCDNLTGTEIASNKKRREDRKARFIKSTRWKYSRIAEKHRISQNGIEIEIAQEQSAYRVYMNRVKGKRTYVTVDSAKEHVFDILENGEQSSIFSAEKPPNTACSRPAQLPKLGVSFDGWRSGRWRAADAEAVGATSCYR